MKLYPYGILEDDDVFMAGDEVRCLTPYSAMTQNADVELDIERMRWMKVYPVWYGKTFYQYRSRARGNVQGRRFIGSE